MVMKKAINVTDEIWKSYKEKKDVETRNFIMMEYLHIVKYLASRIHSTYKNLADQDDMISCGSIALLNSIERYDYTRNIKFETFASIGIRGAMIDYLRKQDWVPRALRKSVKEIDMAYAELQNTLGRTPSDIEMAAKLELNVEEYYDILGKTYSLNILSIEELMAESNFAEHSQPPSPDLQPDQQLEHKELAEILAKAIENLGEKERIIISLFYYEGLKAKQIASILEVTESRISQLHSKALMRLKYEVQKYIM